MLQHNNTVDNPSSLHDSNGRYAVFSALPYGNNVLHLGHLVGYISADIFCRCLALQGISYYHICGTDAHGTPIMLAARKNNVTSSELAQQYYTSHQDDLKDFSIYFDQYVSTDNPEHTHHVHQFYTAMNRKYLYTQSVEQFFDEERSMFLSDRMVRGVCPCCKAEDRYGDHCDSCGANYDAIELYQPRIDGSNYPIKIRKSQHLFFRLSNLNNFLSQHLQSCSVDQHTRRRLQGWLEELHDWDISRSEPYAGIAIPDESHMYFYVWFDAPIAYITGAHLAGHHPFALRSTDRIVHFFGKDIAYFHMLFWPAVLHASNLRLPAIYSVNGFLTVNGQKMSKSRGTFITAKAWSKYVNTDLLRYFFASKISDNPEDIDLSVDDIMHTINREFIAKYINIFSRCARLLCLHCSSKFAQVDQYNFNEVLGHEAIIYQAYMQRNFKYVIESCMAACDIINRRLNVLQPWKTIIQAESFDQAHQAVTIALKEFFLLSRYLSPIIPKLILKIEAAYGMSVYNSNYFNTLLDLEMLQDSSMLCARITTLDLNFIVQ